MICFVLVVLKFRVAPFYLAKLTEIMLTYVFGRDKKLQISYKSYPSIK